MSDLVTFSIRVPADLKEKLAQRADRNDRTLNGEVLQILKAALNAKVKEAA